MKKYIFISFLITAFILCFGGAVSAKLINFNIEGDNVVFDDTNNMWWYPQISSFSCPTYTEAQMKINELNDLAYGGFNNWQLASMEQVDNMSASFNEGNNTLKDFAFPWEPFSDYFTPQSEITECVWRGGGTPNCEADDYDSVLGYVGLVENTYKNLHLHDYSQAFFTTSGYSELFRIDEWGSNYGAWVVATFDADTAVNALESLARDSVDSLLQADPPGVCRMIRKIYGKRSLVNKIAEAVTKYANGEIDTATYTEKLYRALSKLNSYDKMLGKKIARGKIVEPEASALVSYSANMRKMINSLIRIS